MSTERYRIQFDGGIVDGFSAEAVKANVQALFNVSSERASRLFDGTSRNLKKDLSLDQANRYRDRLLKAGAAVAIQPMDMVPPAFPGESAGAPEPDKPQYATSLSELAVEPVDGEEGMAVNSAAPAAAVAAGEGQGEPASTGPARFEARPVGSTPIQRPVRKTIDPEDFRDAEFRFTGRGGEYFGIWIVNILLTIVTFGIYSAWATVRNNQYFYANTQLEGASFQYLADPVTILKGRLTAFFAFILYALVVNLVPGAAIILGIGFMFAIPWIVIRSLRFRAINSAYRNVRFDFEASYADALMVMVAWPFLNLLALFLLTPFSVLKTHRFMGNGFRYGTTRFRFDSTNSEYYAFFGKGLLMAIGFAVGGIIAFTLISPKLAVLVFMAGYLSVFGYFMAGLTNIFVNNLTLRDHSLHSHLSPKQMLWIYLSNSALVVLTLGLFTPWAKVRMARYRAACTEMTIAGDLDGFVAAENRRTSALGQELGDAFDVGVAAF
ncbi:DUF898 domain-containing protein [Marinobacter halodurans]|uniref:DUF898 domain-containing protein n=1 Tax=Marinobacter halodurans TaxID=2528979 RepID=A0ABY1ZR50_9GAMM|nr:YjgN family protein [Marinobacter halodurans]TBW59611.1 DUF898 domain-containing protein [Marinobacter halodurans]